MVVQSGRRFCPFPLMCCSDIIRETYCATLGHPETNVLQVAALFSPSGNSGTAPALWKHEERTWFLQINIISQEILSGGSRGLLALLLNKVTPSRHLLLSLTFEGRRSNTDWDCLCCPDIYQRQWAQTEMQGVLPKHREALCCHAGHRALAQAVQRGCEVLGDLPGDLQNLSGYSPGHSGLGVSAWADVGVDGFRGPFQL